MKELTNFRKYLNEGIINENLKVGDKGTIEIDGEDDLVVVIQNPNGKEEAEEDFKNDVIWVEFLEGQFKGGISSYSKDVINTDKYK